MRTRNNSIERKAEYELLNLLPAQLQPDYKAVLVEELISSEQNAIIKAANTISAYMKCQMEVGINCSLLPIF